jgi:hypothetical protein
MLVSSRLDYFVENSFWRKIQTPRKKTLLEDPVGTLNSLRTICLMILTIAPLSQSIGQEKRYSAIIPAFHDRLTKSGRESVLQLQRQRFVLFVYRNAVAVSSEADFLNTGVDTLSQEFALPSTGHGEIGDEPHHRISNGILSVQLWIEGQRIAPDLIHESNEDWYTIRSRFAPAEHRRVKAVFWAQTSLAGVDSLQGLDTVVIPAGKRSFVLDLSHATVWKNVIEAIDVTVVLKGGMSFQRDSVSCEPDTYHLQDSTITWSLRNAKPSPGDNIVVSYTPSGRWGSAPNTMARLETYIVKTVYDRLLDYVKQIDGEHNY